MASWSGNINPDALDSQGDSRQSKKRQATLDKHLTVYNKLDAGTVRTANTKLMLWVAKNGISFLAVDDQEFVDFLHVLCPGYEVPGATQLRTTVLNETYTEVYSRMMFKLGHARYITLSSDFWTDVGTHGVFGCIAHPETRQEYLLKTVDASPMSHNATYIKDEMQKCVDMVGKQKVVAITTDNAAAARLGRELLIAEPGYEHILEFRCSMHSFGLLIGSILAHPLAKDIITRAQRVVTYFRSSTQPLAQLRYLMDEDEIKGGGLKSSNKTRFTSVHLCLDSVMRLESALHILAGRPGLVKNADVVATIRDLSFWRKLKVLCDILEPASKAVMAIQSKAALLADVPRFWAYMASALQASVQPLLYDPEMRGFALHAAKAFNTRSKEMDTPYLRLALFLDARFKTCVKTTGEHWQELQTLAIDIARRRSYTLEQGRALSHQLHAYNTGLAGVWPEVLQSPSLNIATSPVEFWTPMRERVPELAELALAIHAIVPHAASAERLFSALGWFQGGRRASLRVDTAAKLAAIKMAVDQRRAKPGLPKAAHTPENSNLTVQLSESDEEATPEELNSALDALWDEVQAMDPAGEELPPDGISFTELLMGAWDGFDMRQAAVDDAVVQAAPAATIPLPSGTASWSTADLVAAPALS